MSKLFAHFIDCALAVDRYYRYRARRNAYARRPRPVLMPATTLKDSLKLALKAERSKRHG